MRECDDDRERDRWTHPAEERGLEWSAETSSSHTPAEIATKKRQRDGMLREGSDHATRLPCAKSPPEDATRRGVMRRGLLEAPSPRPSKVHQVPPKWLVSAGRMF